MRRLRPLEFFTSGHGLGILVFFLVGLAGVHPLQAEAPLPPMPASTPWNPADWEGLDRQLEAVLDRPVPARIEEAPILNAASGGLAPAAGTHRSEISPTPGSSPDLDRVFGDVYSELAAEAGGTTAGETSAPQQAVPAPANGSAAELGLAIAAAKSRTIPPQVAALRSPIEMCLQTHAQQRLNSGQDSCWSMMHAFLGWGPDCQIHIGNSRGPLTGAIAWVGQNQPCGGRRLFYLEGNRIRGREGPGYQGHPAQFLAMLAQCDVATDFQLRVNDRPFTVADLIDEEKRTCFAGMELTFKLMGLVHYLGTDATWKNDRGETWDIAKLLAAELAQPINGAACGGTHRIMAISYAVAKRREEGGAMEGHWWRAEKYVNDYHRYALTLQNRDGTFSSDWFRQKSAWGDINRHVQTTGHILEWLVFSLPEEELYDPRLVHSVTYLTQALSQHRYHDWEVGPKGHAIRALRLYYERVFVGTEEDVAPLAQRRDASARDR